MKEKEKRKRKPVEVTFRRLSGIYLPAFESVVGHSCSFTSSAATVDAFTTQLVETVAVELESVTSLKTSLRLQSKPITKWLSTEAAASKGECRRLEKKLENERLRDGLHCISSL